jgi:small-conductance mechanosensitive channel
MTEHSLRSRGGGVRTRPVEDARASQRGLSKAVSVTWPIFCLVTTVGGCGADRGAGVADAETDPAGAVIQVDSAPGAASDTEDSISNASSAIQADTSAGLIAPPIDSALAGAQVTATDSLGQEVAALRDRQGELERVNDSLQAVVMGLTSLISSGALNSSVTDTTSQRIVNEIQGQVQHYGIRAFWAAVVSLLLYMMIRGIVFVLERLAERSAKRRLFYKRLVPIVRIVFWALGVYFVVRYIFGVDAQGLLAAGAAIGVAVGFAAQEILKNIFGGIIVVFDQPFQVGDKISVGGTYGEVVSIGLRSTRIVTPDDNLVSVPNAQVVANQVANANAGELNCQVVTDLYLPSWVDEARAKRLAYEAAAGSRYAYLNKPIVVLVKDEFDVQPVLHLKVKAYVLDPRYEFLLMSDVTERARVAMRNAGMSWDAPPPAPATGNGDRPDGRENTP